MPKRYESYFAQPAPEEVSKLIVCTDDGGMENVTYATQFAAGAYGIGIAAHTASSINGHAPEYSDLSLDGKKAAALTGGVTHEECAALLGARQLDEWYIANSEETYVRAEQLYPGVVSMADVEKGLCAAAFRLDSSNGMFVSHETVLQTMADASEDGIQVPHLSLHRQGAHIADQMIANDIAGTYFDTRRAYDDKNAAYGFTVHRLGDIGMRLEALFPGVAQNDAFVKAAVIQHAVVSGVLPNSEGISGVTPVYRGSDFAKVA